VALTQGAGDRVAAGTVSVVDDAGAAFRAVRLGPLQVAEGWAAVTGTLALEGGEGGAGRTGEEGDAGRADAEMPFLLVLDTADPRTDAATTVVLSTVHGPRFEGWTDALPEIFLSTRDR